MASFFHCLPTSSTLLLCFEGILVGFVPLGRCFRHLCASTILRSIFIDGKLGLGM